MPTLGKPRPPLTTARVLIGKGTPSGFKTRGFGRSIRPAPTIKARVGKEAKPPDLGSGAWGFEYSHGHQFEGLANRHSGEFQKLVSFRGSNPRVLTKLG